MNDQARLFQTLNKRRQDLRMTYAVLARRSGLSRPTVVRALSQKAPHTSFENVLAICRALGIGVALELVIKPEEIRETQAKEKARRLVGIVQGSSALEGQALDEETIADMTRQTAHELLAGSSQRLWDE
jgi:DNA-binding phage protein